MCLKRSFAASTGLRRISGDVLNAKLFERSTHFGQVRFVHLASCHRCIEVVAASIRVQAGKQAIARNGLAYSMKTRSRALLVAKEHAGVLTRGIVHGHHQIPHGVGHPFVGARILVNHHALQWHAFALDAVLAALLGHSDHACTLQHAFDPAVAARARILSLVLAVKVGHVRACKTAFVELHDLVNFNATGAAFGYLAESFVQQTV